MRACRLILILCWTLLFVSCEESSTEKEIEEEEDDGENVFRATNEWKKLPKHQAIPRGLHVRMNLQTGEREAKLYNPKEISKEDEKGEISAVTELERDGPKLADAITKKELKRILHKMEGNERMPSEQEARRVQSKFRSYEELKKEMAKLEAEVKTDSEIMAELIERYVALVEERKEKSSEGLSTGSKSSKTVGEVPAPVQTKPASTVNEDEEEELNILTDLEYLVHQFDNAKEFVKKGLNTVVFRSLNSTWSRVRAEATILLGSAIQSNPSAQIAALDSGAIDILLKTIVLDPAPQVKSGALYALSCLVRRFPAAQAKLLERGGLAILSKLFDSDASHLLKLQVRVITFINDLIMEKRDTESAVIERRAKDSTYFSEVEKKRGQDDEERLRQYNTIGLERRLREEGWCANVVKVLHQDFQGEVDHDRLEKLLTAVTTLFDNCLLEFMSDDTLMVILEELESTYLRLSQDESPGESTYFSTLHSVVANLTQQLNRFVLKADKDEL